MKKLTYRALALRQSDWRFKLVENIICRQVINPSLLFGWNMKFARIIFFFTWPGLRSLFFAQHEGYGNAWRERFDPVRMKLAKTNWMYLELSLRKSLLLNLFVFTVSCCYLLFIHFTFLKNQYTIVENEGALDVISKTFR